MQKTLLILLICLGKLAAAREAKPGETGLVFFGNVPSEEAGREALISAARKTCQREACQLLLLLGNSVPHLSDLYSELRADVFPVLGDRDAAAAEELFGYAAKSPYWNFPARHYTFARGDVSFFAIDTTRFDRAEEKWLKEELERARAKWKIVYGHHPVEAASLRRLRPLLEAHADFYLSAREGKSSVKRDRDVVYVSPGTRELGYLTIDRDTARLEVVGSRGKAQTVTVFRKGGFAG